MRRSVDIPVSDFTPVLDEILSEPYSPAKINEIRQAIIDGQSFPKFGIEYQTIPDVNPTPTELTQQLYSGWPIEG